MLRLQVIVHSAVFLVFVMVMCFVHSMPDDSTDFEFLRGRV